MSVMLLTDRHIATIAVFVADIICTNDARFKQQTAQHLAQELKRCNIEAVNARYPRMKKEVCRKVNIKEALLLLDSEVCSLAACWDYNSDNSGRYFMLQGLLESVFNGVERANDVWTI